MARRRRRCRQGERSETAFLNIIRPRAFYYSTRDRSGQEFDPAARKIFTGYDLSFFLSFSPFFRPLFLFLFSFFHQDEFVPIDADRIGRIMLLRRRNEVFRFSPSTRALVFYVKTEQFYSTSSSTLLSSPVLFSHSPSLSFFLFPSVPLHPSPSGTSFRRCHKFHPRYPPPLVLLHCYSPIYSDILELNLVPATHFEALPRLLWLAHLIRISRIPISRPQCSTDTSSNYIFVFHVERMRLSVSSSFRAPTRARANLFCPLNPRTRSAPR